MRSSGTTIEFPGSAMWDGKYITFVLQEGGTTGEGMTIQRARESKSGDLTFVGQTKLTDNCDNSAVDIVNPFIVGKRNTPVNRVEGDTVVAADLWCTNEGYPQFYYWRYPAGGLPFKTLNGSFGAPYGQAVSIAP
ncbi:MAG TPA: hypothetical protein VGX91_03385 [Candidatus Cybelea sp.]|nr:hypothetical protein [Candidatus Cybelea sp.]